MHAKLMVSSEAAAEAVSKVLEGSSDWGRGRIAQVCNNAAPPLGSDNPLQVPFPGQCKNKSFSWRHPIHLDNTHLWGWDFGCICCEYTPSYLQEAVSSANGCSCAW